MTRARRWAEGQGVAAVLGGLLLVVLDRAVEHVAKVAVPQ